MKHKLLTILAFSLIFAPHFSYCQAIVGHWRFDRNGSEFQNLKGASTVSKVMSTTPNDSIPVVEDSIGEIKKVIELDGLGNEWISAPAYLKGESFTIEFWIKLQKNKQDMVVVANGSGIVIGTHRDNSVYFTLAKGVEQVTWSYVEVPQVIVLDQWLHIAAVFSQGNQQLFVGIGNDFQSSPTLNVEMPKKYNLASTFVGLNQASSNKTPFQGRIAALKIYAGALTEEDFRKSNP